MAEKKRVLIVDDEPINRLGLKLLLNQDAGLEVVAEASNGQEALECVKSFHPDLVLMDVKMPIMDGIQAATYVKQGYPDVKIIMLSSVNTEEEVLGALTAGASGYCLKESNPERLFTAIKAVHEGDVWLDSAIATLVLEKLKGGSRGKSLPVSISKRNPSAETTDKYAAMSTEELKLLGLMVEGHAHDQLADLLSIEPDALRKMQSEIMNKIAVLESTKLAEVSLKGGKLPEESERNMECPTCNNRFVDKVVRCPYDGTRLVWHKPDPLIGTTFADRFEIQSLIGQGSGGTVYKARHKFIKRTLAIKVMHVDLMTDLSLVQRFRQEAEAASSLNHPNIISVVDFGLSQEGYAYMVMDMLHGPSLSDLLRKLGHMNVDAAVQIFAQCAEGLDHAHKKGIIHRDFKPNNVILVGDAEARVQAKIVDFGIVKFIRPNAKPAPELTMQGEIFGTPQYMSPEQCSGFDLTPATDIYSWGVSLYETLASVAPFSAPTVLELMYKHIKESPVPLRSVASSSISDELCEVVMKCLEKEPKNRFESMAAAKDALLRAFKASLN
jgi:DNA-binding NarL/FixJ family response regulator/tRNA A-37 threonylcarbamoyl transferase component Bud32